MTQATDSGIEKRRHPRTVVEMTLRGIRLDPEGGEVVDWLRMQDISRSGMGAVSARPFYPGQRFVLCLPLSGDTGRRHIYATVRRCRPGEDGYRVGLEFDNAAHGAYNAAAGVLAAA